MTLRKRSIGYVGGSITELPVVGYHETTDAKLMWKRLDYGGGTITAWLDVPTYFARFEAEAAKHKPDVVWWMLCARDDGLPATDAALWGQVLELLAAIDSRLPIGCRLYVSTMAAYAPNTDPHLQQAPKRLEPMTDRLVAEGHALAGPRFPMLTTATMRMNGTGHQNKAGRDEAGRILATWTSTL